MVKIEPQDVKALTQVFSRVREINNQINSLTLARDAWLNPWYVKYGAETINALLHNNESLPG